MKFMVAGTVGEGELRARLDVFEKRHDLPSDRMVEAFVVDGCIVETDELREWQSTFAAWRLCRRYRDRAVARAS